MKKAAAAGALLSVLSVTVILVLGSMEPEAEAGDDLTQALSACRGGVETLAAAGAESSRECMEAVSLAAIRENRLPELQAAFEGEIAKIKGMQNLCHDIGHYTGREAYKSGASVGDLLKEATEVCIFGFGHGVMDGIAASNPSEEVLRETAAACAALEGVSIGLCVDGLGHLAWSASGNLEDAVEICGYLPETLDRRQCGEGIIMQIYAPAGFLPSADIRDAPGELEQLCSVWPEPSDIRDGCYTGAGYTYMQGVSTLYFLWRSDQNRHPSSETVEGIREQVEGAVSLCDRHIGPAGVLLCHESIYYQIPATIEELRPGLKQELCALIDERLMQECMDYWPYFG